MSKKTLIFIFIILFPVIYLLDFVVDGCISDFSLSGATLCGDEAKKHLAIYLPFFAALCAVLWLRERKKPERASDERP